MSHRRRRDEGAILVWVGVMIVALIGMGALVIDLGAVYVERRELQNGADAGALAVAQDCASLATCATARVPTDLARTAADNNASDGSSAVRQVCGSGGGLPSCPVSEQVTPPTGSQGWVRVDTQTRTTSGSNQLPLRFAPIVGINGTTVNAKAVAAWGSGGTVATLPFVVCLAQVREAVGPTQPPPTFVSGPVVVFAKDQGGGNRADDCPSFSGGGTIAGNFSWLTPDPDSALCQTTITIPGTVAGDPGANNTLAQRPCELTPSDVLGQTFPLPVFDVVQGTGQNARYNIVGFAAFRVEGFQLGSTDWNRTAGCTGPIPTGPGGQDVRFFCGRFTGATFDGTIGPSTGFGATIVQMIG